VEFSLKLKPDIILMDVDMPRLDGVTATRLIRGCLPEVRVLMLSMHDEDARIVAAVQAGACGYVLKDADHHEFLRIIRATYRGEQVRSPFMPDRFAKRVVGAIKAAEGPVGTGVTALTEREREILACAAAGRGNKDIADQLCVSPDTVKTHLHHIYQKLGVAGRVEAILTYLQSK
jgi:DNA-binding NarL/FixJ family response regulator